MSKCQCSTGCSEQAAGEGAPEPSLCHQCNGHGCDVALRSGAGDDPCPYDTDGDGDCAYCYGRGCQL